MEPLKTQNDSAVQAVEELDNSRRRNAFLEALKISIADVPKRVFEILYSTENVEKAINAILGVLGEVNHVSRVYIFEDTPDHEFCCNTFEWCAPGIKPEIENLSKLSYQEDLGGCYLDNFDADGIFFCPDITTLPKVQYEMLAAQEIVSMLQSAIMENGEFKGYIGFDECTRKMKWTEEQKDSLLFVAKIISTFLCKMRREEALKKSNQELQKSLVQLEREHKQLQESERRIELIMDHTAVSIWEYIANTKPRYISVFWLKCRNNQEVIYI